MGIGNRARRSTQRPAGGEYSTGAGRRLPIIVPGVESLISTLSWFCVSLVAAIINWPLARFPSQDSMYNDQILLGRTAWAKESLIENPGAFIDFTQGLGGAYPVDVKVIPHIFDPAVLFLFFLDPFYALGLRNMFLVFICLLFLDKLWHLYSDNYESEWPTLKTSLFLFYVFSPQFFQEVGHHFTSIFYALPFLLYATHKFACSPCWKNSIGLAMAQTLFVALSDLNLAFFIPIIAVFAISFDHDLRKKHLKYLLTSFVGFSVIAIFSYASIIRQLIFNDLEGSTSPVSVWHLDFYLSSFMKSAMKTLLLPRFENPVGLYVFPLLGFVFICFGYRSKAKLLFKDLKIFILLSLLLFGLGIIAHGVPWIRERLPSHFRYHLICFPYLFTIFLIMHHQNLSRILDKVKKESQYLKTAAMVAIPIFFLLPLPSALKHRGEHFLTFQGYILDFPPYIESLIFLIAFALLPMLYLWPVFYAARYMRNPWSKAVFTVILAISIAGVYYTGRSFSRSNYNFTFVSSQMYKDLYEDFPQHVNRVIENSNYAWAPRSFVLTAVGRSGRGRNDKLLPIIEYPEHIKGRAFFQWRYTYTKHTKVIYNKMNRDSHCCFFPPVPRRIENTLEFAEQADAPFLISADAIFERSDLDLLGKFELTSVDEERIKPLNRGLVGTIYIYAIKPVIAKLENSPFDSSEYSRVSASYRGLKSSKPEIRLPLTYIKGIRAYDENGRQVSLYRGRKGFVMMKNDGSYKDLEVKSWSSYSFISSLAPLAGFLALISIGSQNYRRELRQDK